MILCDFLCFVFIVSHRIGYISISRNKCLQFIISIECKYTLATCGTGLGTAHATPSPPTFGSGSAHSPHRCRVCVSSVRHAVFGPRCPDRTDLLHTCGVVVVRMNCGCFRVTQRDTHTHATYTQCTLWCECGATSAMDAKSSCAIHGFAYGTCVHRMCSAIVCSH